jgi:hypothetical protein
MSIFMWYAQNRVYKFSYPQVSALENLPGLEIEKVHTVLLCPTQVSRVSLGGDHPRNIFPAIRDIILEFGKSTLVNHWLGRMAAEQYRSAQLVFGWSFCL